MCECVCVCTGCIVTPVLPFSAFSRNQHYMDSRQDNDRLKAYRTLTFSTAGVHLLEVAPYSIISCFNNDVERGRDGRTHETGRWHLLHSCVFIRVKRGMSWQTCEEGVEDLSIRWKISVGMLLSPLQDNWQTMSIIILTQYSGDLPRWCCPLLSHPVACK